MGNSDELHISGLWFDNGRGSEHSYRAFEAYGHAMACAASLELQLSLMILKGIVLSKSKRTNQRSQDEMSALAEQVRKATFPKLMALLRKNFDISEELREALEIAKNGRDDLAHGFWDINLGLLRDEDGVELIAKQCAISCWHFREVSQRIVAELGFDVTDYVDQNTASGRARRNEWRSFVDNLING